MDDTRKLVTRVGASAAVYVGSWGLVQYLPTIVGPSWIFELIFTSVVQVGAGLAAALVVIERFGLTAGGAVSRRSRLAGAVVLVAALLVSALPSGALSDLAAVSPGVASVAKYVMLFAPMCLAVCFQCFVLVPRVVEKVLGDGVGARLLAISLCGLYMGLCFLADGLGDLEFAATMAILGLCFGAGMVLTRSLALTYPAFLAAILVNTLAEARYFGMSWAVLTVEVALAAVVLSVWVWWRRRS